MPLPMNTTQTTPPMASAARTAPSPASPFIGPRTLPNRNVTAETFEDAYVSFIMYCNPAVPHGTDTATLREAIRALPKSGGKCFDAFHLFLLVRQLEMRELKTWADVALKLGVDPPDRDKGESPHKVQSYAVRLKRWMHAMHVDAFFEYLMGLPHPYWTAIPTDPNPIQEAGRDGVAPVDDMALRALVPQARPKRIRKRAGEVGQNTTPPSRRPGSMSTTAPLSPNHPGGEKSHQRRHGAKVVSSAWRSRGLGGTGGRVRGRPPAEQPPSTNTHGSFSRFSAVDTAPRDGLMAPNSGGLAPATSSAAPAQMTAPPRIPLPNSQVPLQPSGPARPSLPLQVPNGAGGTAPIAAPPPPSGTINGRPCPEQNAHTTEPPLVRPNLAPPVDLPQHVCQQEDTTYHARRMNEANSTNWSDGAPIRGPTGFLRSMRDRTNIDAVCNFLVHETKRAEWSDEDGNPLPPCSLDLARAITQSTFEALHEAAPSNEAFLINLSALSGAKLLMTTTKLKMRRMAEYSDRTLFSCSWEYQLGDIRGQYQMTQTVLHDRWKGAQTAEPPSAGASEQDDVDEENNPSSSNSPAGNGSGEEGVDWKKKYDDLLREVQAKDKQLEELKATVWCR
ncbi:hypothetical protein ACRALDRAFT_2050222 [Sodiomyces alcalophilus JCM 7366]|uniref:uncharacterized protein n=1 Tax=Sodiomyces alcalophilus JCM 7366 TaxID=591952 RepID=UPI0039B649E5